MANGEYLSNAMTDQELALGEGEEKRVALSSIPNLELELSRLQTLDAGRAACASL